MFCICSAHQYSHVQNVPVHHGFPTSPVEKVLDFSTKVTELTYKIILSNLSGCAIKSHYRGIESSVEISRIINCKLVIVTVLHMITDNMECHKTLSVLLTCFISATLDENKLLDISLSISCLDSLLSGAASP